MRSRALAPLAAAALLATAVSPSPAQQGEPLAEGSYRISVDGRAVGTEAFAVRRQGRDVRAVGRVRLDTAAAGLSPVEVWLQTDGDYRPGLFRLRPEAGGPEAYTAVREGDRVRVRTSAAEGERFREFLAPEGVVVFDPRIAHHWFLVLRYRSDDLGGDGAEVPAVLPVRNDRVRMRVRRAGEEQVSVAGATATATRHEVAGGVEATVWTGGDGRVLRLELPAIGLTSEWNPDGGQP